MTTFLSNDVQAGLNQALMSRRKSKSRLRVMAGDKTYAILSLSGASFSLDADDDPKLRGLVDIFDGATHQIRALIVASHRDGDEMVFAFKQSTRVTDRPALDFEQDQAAPVGFLPHRR